MITTEIQVTNERGLHARAAAKLVQLGSTFTSTIFISKGDYQANAKSILGVLTLAATCGTFLTLAIDGEDEATATDALVRLINDRFDEETTLTEQEKRS